MISINTNLSSLVAQNSMKSATNNLNTAIERMSTGYKINHAKDNAANYSISTNMSTKIGAYNIAEDNTAMGLDMITTASESLSLIEDKLTRLRDLAIQASNGTYDGSSIGQIQEVIKAEATSLVEEVERLYNTTEYNGINLAKGNISNTESSAFIKDIDRRDTSGMKRLANVDETVALESGTYSISTPEELAKLATMTNNGLIAASTEFVLANNIDLSVYANWTPIGNGIRNFEASFDGNGYVISNIKINSSMNNYVGLFGKLSSGIVKNVGLENGNITGANSTGLLIGEVTGFAIVDNCYSTGQVKGWARVGGLIGMVGGHETYIFDAYSNANVIGSKFYIGGFTGMSSDRGNIQNCYATGNVTGEDVVGGFIGVNGGNIQNCYATGNVTATLGSYVENFCAQNTGVLSLATIGSITNNAKINIRNSNIVLQVGTSSFLNSNISFLLGYDLSGLNSLRNLRHDDDYIEQIDLLLSLLSNKQTEYGAVQNRLESVLEEITIQRDNLVSSRSTIRDADIAEVSSTYIQQQILQQASATLLATANQTPSIALQLI